MPVRDWTKKTFKQSRVHRLLYLSAAILLMCGWVAARFGSQDAAVTIASSVVALTANVVIGALIGARSYGNVQPPKDDGGETIGPEFPHLWDLFAYLLPRKLRKEIYEPLHQELLEDYLLARKKYKTKLARRWLALCFTVRTIWMVGQCLSVMLGEKGWRVVRWVFLTLLGERAVRGLREVWFQITGKF